MTAESQEHVLNAAGEFDIHDEPVDIGHYRFEDWIAFAIFWVLALVIFYQFFTRYALNDSASWTEEIARYLLIATAFVGASMNVRKNNHIHVDFFYRLLPRWITRPMSKGAELASAVVMIRPLTFPGGMLTTRSRVCRRGRPYAGQPAR